MSLARGSQVNKRVDSEDAAVLRECTFLFEVPIRIEALNDKRVVRDVVSDPGKRPSIFHIFGLGVVR